MYVPEVSTPPKVKEYPHKFESSVNLIKELRTKKTSSRGLLNVSPSTSADKKKVPVTDEMLPSIGVLSTKGYSKIDFSRNKV